MPTLKKFIRYIFLAYIIFSCVKPKTHVDIFINNIGVPDLSSGKIIENQYVAIKDGLILEMGDSKLAKKYTAKEWLFGEGFYLIPGLWDNHVHFGGADYIDENIQLLNLYLAMGVTTVRDAAGDISNEVLKWRDQINNNRRLGPRIFTSGPKIEGKGSVWPGDLEVGNPEELTVALDSLDKLKVDFVKITDNTLTPELFLQALETAKKRGYPVSAHLPIEISLTQASRAGLSTVEHLSYALRGISPDEVLIASKERLKEITSSEADRQRITSLDTATALQNFRQLAQAGTRIVPTIFMSKTLAYLDQNNHAKDTFLYYLGPKLKASYQWRVDRASKDDSLAIEARHFRFKKTAELIPLLKEAGVKIMAGTDAGYLNAFNYPGLSLHEELKLLVESGLSPHEALLASVENGPSYFGEEENYGRVATGKIADLVILGANPLENISHTQHIEAVIRKGVFYDRYRLDSLLLSTKKWVEKKERIIN